MANRFVFPVEQRFDANGNPLAGGKLYFYENGTSTPKDTYSDEALTTPNANPVVADSNGVWPDIWMDGTYTVKLTDSDDVTQPGFPKDDVEGPAFNTIGSGAGEIPTNADLPNSSSVGTGADQIPRNDQVGAFLPSVTDGGTDALSGDFGRDVSAGETVRGDFSSANTTTTPTLENTGGTPSGALTITTRDGSALWAGALTGVHELQLNAGGTAWLVLDPVPLIPAGTQATSSNTANAIVQRDANGRAKFADPSAAQDAVTFGVLGAEKIESGSVSAVSSLDITGLTSAYRAYVLVFDDLVPATDGVKFQFRVTTDGGTSFDSGASDYLWATSNNAGGSTNTSDSDIQLSRDLLGTAAGEPGISGQIWVHNPADASGKTGVTFSLSAFKRNDGVVVGAVGSGRRDAAQAEDGFRVFMDTGNISTMNYTLYGLR